MQQRHRRASPITPIIVILLTAAIFGGFYATITGRLVFTWEGLLGMIGLGSPSSERLVLRVVKEAPEETAEHISNSQVPAWTNVRERQRKLVEVFTIGGKKFRDSRRQFRNPSDMELDSRGNLYILEQGRRQVKKIDPEGKLITAFGQDPKAKIFLTNPIDLAIGPHDVVYLLDDERDLIVMYESSGKAIGEFEISVKGQCLAVDRHERIFVVAPKDAYLVHAYNVKGREIARFFPRPEGADPELATVLLRGLLDARSPGSLYFSFEYPYKLVKFDEELKPEIVFNRRLSEDTPPYEVMRDQDGQITGVARQQVSYDIETGPAGRVFNIVRTRGVTGGNNIDVFAPDGQFLQTFYLDRSVSHFEMAGDSLLYVLDTKSNARLTKLRIENVW